MKLLSMKIRSKLTVLLLVFGLLPLAGVMPIIFNKLNDMQHSTLDDMHTSAEVVGELIDRNLFERYGDVQAFTTNAASKDVHNWYKQSDTPLVASMNAYMTNYGLYKLMVLVDMDGRVAAVNSVDPKGKALDTANLYTTSFKDAAWFQKAKKKEFLKSDALDGTVVEQPHYNSTVSGVYAGEDGFVLTFAAPVYDYAGTMIGVWANFADFGLVESIVKDVYQQKKNAGAGGIAFAIQDANGTALVNYDPTARAELEQRDSTSIGKKSLESLEIPAAADALKDATGARVELDTGSGEEDAVAWAKSDGSMGFPGLGWTVIMHQPGTDAFAGIVSAKSLLLMVSAAALGIILGVGAFVGTMASRPLRKSQEVAQALAGGDYGLDIEDKGRGDEIGELTRGMIELRKSVEKSINLQTMIDNLSLPVMLCDKNYNIIYVNNASRQALKKLERLLPIPVDKIVGSSIDIFHKNPSHQRGMLADASKLPHQTKFPIGDEWLSLNANMLQGPDGKFNGAFVDWRVITDEVRNDQMVQLAQKKIQELIAAAQKGELSERLDVAAFSGFYKDLAESMNGLMDTIVEPITRATDVLKIFADGNLAQTMTGEYQGAFKQIQEALNGTIVRLRDTVRRIIETSTAVNSASSEISAGSADLSQRTEQQASNLEETAASMEEITGAVKQNTENANTAKDLALKANGVAEEGGNVVGRAVQAMGEIEHSSQKIADIIGVIDEIAFQTNLLALNAAVEAARAGEAGKGFAVVAQEVRSLAGRSASASKEIKTLISESVEQVKSGAELVNQAGSTLKDIVSAVRKVTDIMNEIAAASVEQSSGIGEINNAITQMDEMTQQNAALVEENTAAAQSLVDQSRALEQMMRFFKLDEASAAEGVAASAPAEAPAVAAASAPVRKAPAPRMAGNGKANGHAKPSLVAKARAVGKGRPAARDAEWEEF